MEAEISFLISKSATLYVQIVGAEIAETTSCRGMLSLRGPLLLRRRPSGRLQDELLLVPAPHHLKKLPQPSVVLRLEQTQVDHEIPAQMQQTVLALRRQAVGADLQIGVLWLREAADLPARGRSNGYIIHVGIR